ncbi:MAG TPA: TIGR04283 family arsenosugar biosynthesis glycosyltransferase [Bryobacteraceae bacterium]|nr:TIGR04283 family arsenosugar biosynthesis glycosyltransferase [Bryobacteraceae bacterium]
MRVSIIVPTFNEESLIGDLLRHLREIHDGQIVVADGGSTDRTREIAQSAACAVCTPAVRGVQLNAGAAVASGDILWFLHADVRVGPGALEAMRNCLRDPAVAGGNLDIRYGGDDRIGRILSCLNRWRTRLGWFYGDSGIFCRRSAFEALGGFQPWPVLEDYDFARRLLRMGKVVHLGEPIWVSPRRWQNGGLLATFWSWVIIQGLYWAGVPPCRLAKLYKPVR